MNIGDYVEPVGDPNRLRSGSSVYARAVVASLDPFVLVSEEGDMLWRTVKEHEVVPVAPASEAVLVKVMERYVGDQVEARKEKALPEAEEAVRRKRLVNALASVINQHNVESWCNTPDFVLAECLVGCLESFAKTVNVRERWYGRSAPAWTLDPIEHVSVSGLNPDQTDNAALYRENLKARQLLARSGLTNREITQADLIYALEADGTVFVVKNRYGRAGTVEYESLRVWLAQAAQEAAATVESDPPSKAKKVIQLKT